MFWQKKRLNYDVLIPPIVKPFDKFTKAETEAYFNWFKDQIPRRVEYLQSFSGIHLDYTVNSLEAVWGWFLSIARIEKTTASKLKMIKNQIAALPFEIRKAVLSEQSQQFTLETEYILNDIAIYFGAVIIYNNPKISWGYHREKRLDSFANMPILVGFEDKDFTPPFKCHFELNFMIRGLADRIFDGDHDRKDLLELYNKWRRLMF